MCTPSADIAICGAALPAAAALAGEGGVSVVAGVWFLLHAVSASATTSVTAVCRPQFNIWGMFLDRTCAENLAGVENTVGIERALDRAHQFQLCGRCVAL